jgi:tripartite-type tricarboxylate transporter receptor subunit TctC
MKAARILSTGFVLLTMLGPPVDAMADDSWPTKQPIHLIVPYAAGGNADVVARATAGYMTKALDAHIVVENRPGAGGVIGTLATAKAPADGYWLCVCGVGSISVGPAIEAAPYDPLRDIAPISLINTSPLILVVNRKSPPNSVGELITWANSNPAGLTYGSSGTGGLMHVAGEVFRNRTGIELTHVPYRGSGQTIAALLTGEIDLEFAIASDVMGQISAVRAIGVTTARRSPYLPDVPTIMEQGIRDFDLTSWIGLFAPAGTPESIIARLAQIMADMAKSAETQRIYADFGATAAADSPDQFGEQLRSEGARWKQYLKGLVLKK